MKYLHTCIRVKDLDASVKFYTEALGMHVTRRKDNPEERFSLVFLADEEETFELELTYNEGHGAYELGDGYSHIAFGVEDLEQSHKKHVSEGYQVTEMYSVMGGKPNLYFITDPDGYDIEILTLKK
ncbi:lactoylglutathione lyase [Guggenheimella bovis]